MSLTGRDRTCPWVAGVGRARGGRAVDVSARLRSAPKAALGAREGVGVRVGVAPWGGVAQRGVTADLPACRNAVSFWVSTCSPRSGRRPVRPLTLEVPKATYSATPAPRRRRKLLPRSFSLRRLPGGWPPGSADPEGPWPRGEPGFRSERRGRASRLGREIQTRVGGRRLASALWPTYWVTLRHSETSGGGSGPGQGVVRKLRDQAAPGGTAERAASPPFPGAAPHSPRCGSERSFLGFGGQWPGCSCVAEGAALREWLGDWRAGSQPRLSQRQPS